MVKVKTALVALAAASLVVASEAANLLDTLASTNGTAKGYTLAILQQLLSPAVLGADNAAAIGNLVSTKNLTVFAPSDAAFTAALASLGGLEAVAPLASQVLSYHVSPSVVDAAYLAAANPVTYIPTLLSNSSLTPLTPQVLSLNKQNGSVVLRAAYGLPAKVIDSITADNGVIHVVDAVLIPPQNASTTIGVVNAAAKAANVSVSFNTVAKLAAAANISQTLDTVSPLTVFVPTDKALDTLNSSLASLPNATSLLFQILSYHALVSGGPFYLPDSGNYTTSLGVNVSIVTNKTAAQGSVNGIPVLDSILLSNGVAHVIDKVLIPPALVALIPAPNATNGTSTNATTGGTKSGAQSRVSGSAFGLLAAVAAGIALL